LSFPTTFVHVPTVVSFFCITLGTIPYSTQGYNTFLIHSIRSLTCRYDGWSGGRPQDVELRTGGHWQLTTLRSILKSVVALDKKRGIEYCPMMSILKSVIGFCSSLVDQRKALISERMASKRILLFYVHI
jgi:hypothetical protein